MRASSPLTLLSDKAPVAVWSVTHRFRTHQEITCAARDNAEIKAPTVDNREAADTSVEELIFPSV